MPMGLTLDNIEFSDRALLNEPALAQQVAVVTAKFALIEGVIGGTYGLLKNKAIDAALNELKQLYTNARRVTAVRETLNTRFSGQALAEANGILDAVLKHAENRNKLAHGVWGVAADKPGILFCLPVKKLIPFTASIIAAGTAGTAIESAERLSTFIEHYSSAELTALQLEGDEVLKAALKLYNVAGALAAQEDGWSKKPEDESSNPTT